MFEKFKNFSPGLIIAILGFTGLMFTFVDSSGEIGSKIPITIFFLFITCVGILLLMMPPEKINDTFGEVEAPREFS